MNDDDRKGKTWEELVLLTYEECKKRNNDIQEMLDKIEDMQVCTDDLEIYIKCFKNKIHIPKWTLFSDATPDKLDIYANYYVVFTEPDFFYEATWRDSKFYIDLYEDGNRIHEPNVKYWLPIIYPNPY